MTRHYSSKSRKELAQAFTAALGYLAKADHEMRGRSSKHLNICACVQSAYKAGDISLRIADMACNLIMARLGRNCYYASWIRDRVGDKVYNFDQHHNSGKKTQQGRRRWLQSLIKEFSS